MVFNSCYHKNAAVKKYFVLFLPHLFFLRFRSGITVINKKHSGSWIHLSIQGHNATCENPLSDYHQRNSLFYTWLTGKDLLPFQGHTCRLDIEYYIMKYYIKVWTLPVYVYPQPQDTSLKFSHHYLKPKYIFLNNFMNTSHWLAVNHLLYVLHFLMLNGNSHRLLNLVMLSLSELICLGY